MPVETVTAWAQLKPELLAELQAKAINDGYPEHHLPLGLLRNRYPDAVGTVSAALAAMLSYWSDSTKLPAEARLNADDCVSLGAYLALTINDLSMQWVVFALLQGLHGAHGETYGRFTAENVHAILAHCRGLKQGAQKKLQQKADAQRQQEHEARLAEHNRRMAADPEYVAAVEAEMQRCLEAWPVLKQGI